MDIALALDEIESSIDIIVKSSNRETIKNAKGWIRVQKEILKENGFNGKMPRLPKGATDEQES